LEYTTLGRTGLKVSRLGLGGGGIAQMFGATTRDEAIRTVQRALELGINFFDACYCYGDGEAETVLGLALEGRRDEAIICSKVDFRPWVLDDTDGFVDGWIDAALKRLRTDVIDVLLVHNQFTSVRNEEPYSLTVEDVLGPVLHAFRAVQRAGKARFIGIPSVFRQVPSVKRILDSGEFDVVMPLYHLLNQTFQDPPPPGFPYRDYGQLLPLIRAMNLGVICVQPLAGGRLTPAVDRTVTPGTTAALEVETVGKLGFLLHDGVDTVTKAAMVFCLMNKELHTVVAGAKKVVEIEELVNAANLPPMSSADIYRLNELYMHNFELSTG
jgi:L-galactose dehydrogenase